MSLFPKDAVTTGEKVVYSVGFGIPVVLFLYLFLSAFGVFHNFYADACAQAPGWCKILGLLFTGGLVYSLYLNIKDDKKAPNTLALFLLAALAILSFCAFTYPFWSK